MGSSRVRKSAFSQSITHTSCYILLWYDSAGCGCSWGDPAVSQLFAHSRAPHSGCGQMQEPGVDQWQDHCRSEMVISLLSLGLVFIFHCKSVCQCAFFFFVHSVLISFQKADGTRMIFEYLFMCHNFIATPQIACRSLILSEKYIILNL